MNAESYLRVGFSGLLHCLSPLHVGDGEIAESKNRPADGRKPLTEGHYNTVCMDHRNKPYIPGSTLRGSLAAMLSAKHRALADVLLGDQNRAGKLRVEAAYLKDANRKPLKLPYWHEQRGTYLHRGVGIEPITGTTDAHKLFHHEVVAPGAVFRCQVWLEEPNAEMVTLLRDTLDEWCGQWAHAIGSGRGKGWGRIRYELEQIKTLAGTDLGDWLNQDVEELPYRVQNFTLGDGGALHGASDLRLSLLPQTAFLVNEDYFSTSNSAVSDKSPDLAFNRTADHHALIPGSSLKGWLRSRAHKIAATIAHQHFEAPVDDAWDLVQPLIQDLFGKKRFRSQLWISEAISDKPAGIVTFMMNAIDRFTGGVSIGDSSHLRKDLDSLSARDLEKRGGALFQAEAAECDRLECAVQWDRRRIPLPNDAQKGLLLLVARDALEGELRLGWGQAKGFGEFTIQLHFQQQNIDDWEGLLTVLRQGFGAQAPEAWVTALHQELGRMIDVARTSKPSIEEISA